MYGRGISGVVPMHVPQTPACAKSLKSLEEDCRLNTAGPASCDVISRQRRASDCGSDPPLRAPGSQWLVSAWAGSCALRFPPPYRVNFLSSTRPSLMG